MQTKVKKHFVFLAGIVILLRCLFIFYVSYYQMYAWDDSYQYLQIAKNLPYFSQMSTSPLVPDLQRMPLYPIFLRICGLNPIFILFVQFIIQTVTAFFIYKILSKRTQYAAYLATAYWLMPVSILFSALMLTECLFVFFVIVSMYYFDQKKWIFGSICVTISIFTRPNSLLILFFLCVLGLWHLWQQKTNKKSVFAFITGISIGLACVFVWMYRNYTICQQWKVSLLGDNTLIHGRLGGLLCYQKQLPYTDDNLVCQSEAYLITQNIIPFKTYYSDIHRQETEIYTSQAHKAAYMYILHNFTDYLAFQADCLFQLFKGMGYKSWLNITNNTVLSVFLAVIQMFYTGFCVMIVLSASMRVRKLDFMQKLVFLNVLAMFVLALLPYADTRYRFPVESLSILLYADKSLRL